VRKKDRFKAIFAELRHTLDDSVSAGEVARLARHILRAYTNTEKLGYQDHSGQSREFQVLPTDKLISEEPWQVWQYDRVQATFGGPDEALGRDTQHKLRTIGYGKIGWKL